MCSSNQMNHFPRLATICSERSVCKNFSNRTREVFIGFRRIFQNENFLKPMGNLDAGGLSPQFLTIKLGGDGGVTVLTLQPEFLLTLLILLQSQSLAQHQALCVPWRPLSVPFLHAQFLLPGMLSLPLQVSNSPFFFLANYYWLGEVFPDTTDWAKSVRFVLSQFHESFILALMVRIVFVCLVI